ncbi:hypothetical protein EYR41_001480 [Orbilia oligospora]|uniref:Prokaryotic-type class I peptide chain release factors domain-containing protein n=1 Tax=Orbilia oligospora TaxID=2813651 RepID=A0A8H2HVS7_ORBOL|nr:hypothetical protein EYR41_001480 [Orbilia oligospora]
MMGRLAFRFQPFRPQRRIHVLQEPSTYLRLISARAYSRSPTLCSSSKNEKDDGYPSTHDDRQHGDRQYDENDLDWARNWIAEGDVKKKLAKFPPSIGVITFSRSSGPGGQNVNKVNSKATLRVPLEKLEPHIPRIFFGALKRKGSKYLTDGGDMVISSDSCRSQSTNTKDCWEKLYRAVIRSAQVPGKTSLEKKERVKKLIEKSKAVTRDWKYKLAKKKANRRGGPVGEW